MERTSYHRPLDQPMPRGKLVSAKRAIRCEDQILTVTPRFLEVGDVITQPGLIDMTVTAVTFPATGFAVIHYDAEGCGSDRQTMADPTRLTVRRRAQEREH